MHRTPERVRSDTVTTFRRGAFRIVGGQVLLTAFLAAACLGWGTARWAYSAVVGGLICVIPGAYLAAQVFRGGRNRTPVRLLRSFYLNEAVKIALTVAMFAVAILHLDLNLLVMFLAYVATTMVYWLALLATDDGRPP